MPRARNIKPGFFSNDEITELSFPARLLFIGLWTIADRDGRLIDRPKKIKIEIFPVDDVDVSSLLDELAQHRFIERYADQNGAYIQVVNFTKHQNPHRNEVSSEIPSIADVRAKDGAIDPPKKSRAKKVDVAPDKHPSNRADSLIRNDDSGFLQPDPLSSGDTPDGEMNEAKLTGSSIEERFEMFWASYPRRVGLKPARDAWMRLNPDEALTAAILGAIEAQKQSHDWRKANGQFIPHPTTWLNRGGWKDELNMDEPLQTLGRKQTSEQVIGEFLEWGLGEAEQMIDVKGVVR